MTFHKRNVLSFFNQLSQVPLRPRWTVPSAEGSQLVSHDKKPPFVDRLQQTETLSAYFGTAQ